MTQNDYKNSITSQVANNTINQLISELAAKCVQVDELTARVNELQKSGTPAQEPGHSP
jgi:hypothetical protein